MRPTLVSISGLPPVSLDDLDRPMPNAWDEDREDPDFIIVARAKAGDDEAFTELISRYKLPVTNFIYRMIGNPDDADDLAQEVFVKLYRSLPSFRLGGRCKFSSWVFRIARHRSIDALRQRHRRPHLVSLFGENGANQITDPSAQDRIAENRDLGEVIAAAVACLPEKQRSAFVLAEYHGRTAAEIATIMRCSSKAVESCIQRARRQLADQLRHQI